MALLNNGFTTGSAWWTARGLARLDGHGSFDSDQTARSDDAVAGVAKARLNGALFYKNQ